ncbi:MAG: iron-sulfur cluster assembly scaffold protein [Parcubacteria group bacterium]|nr:iron-sulfur cluster assembly scaffold protein [Parcubacteria group bacterium]
MALNVLNKPVVKEQKWYYTEEVKDHFYNPRNLHKKSDAPLDYDGVGMVGSPACGDYMKMWVKVDKANDRIIDCKWQTFGCASAIGSTSMLSMMVSENGGMKIEDALKLKPQDIMARLGGLPARKVHCSVLGDKAIRSAINDYFRRSGQKDRIMAERARIIDKVTGVTDHDIEEAVLEGANTLEKVQEKTKVGVGNPLILQEVEQLLQFYMEKYFG